jgi:hypothetical protein
MGWSPMLSPDSTESSRNLSQPRSTLAAHRNIKSVVVVVVVERPVR